MIATILADPTAHLGKVYELTGPRSLDLTDLAAEYSDALGRTITYHDVPYQPWVDRVLSPLGLPGHVLEHLATMARLHSEGRYDRVTDDVELVTGRPASSMSDFVAHNPAPFERG